MKEIVVSNNNEELSLVLDFINKNLDLINPSPKFRAELELSIEEIFVNIVNYAYKTTNTKNKINIQYRMDSNIENPSKVIIEVSDSGTPFNPLKIESPDITLSSKERSIGGLGIFLLKKNVDNINYKYENKRNILTIEKNLK